MRRAEVIVGNDFDDIDPIEMRKYPERQLLSPSKAKSIVHWHHPPQPPQPPPHPPPHELPHELPLLHELLPLLHELPQSLSVAHEFECAFFFSWGNNSPV